MMYSVTYFRTVKNTEQRTNRGEKKKTTKGRGRTEKTEKEREKMKGKKKLAVPPIMQKAEGIR